MEVRITRLSDGYKRTFTFDHDGAYISIDRSFVRSGRDCVKADLYISKKMPAYLFRSKHRLILIGFHSNPLRILKRDATYECKHKGLSFCVTNEVVRFCSKEGAEGVGCTDLHFEVWNDDTSTPPRPV